MCLGTISFLDEETELDVLTQAPSMAVPMKENATCPIPSLSLEACNELP